MRHAIHDRAAPDGADIEGQIAIVVGEAGHDADDIGQLHDGVGSTLVKCAGVRAASFDRDLVARHTLPRRYHQEAAVFHITAFEDQRGQRAAQAAPA